MKSDILCDKCKSNFDKKPLGQAVFFTICENCSIYSLTDYIESKRGKIMKDKRIKFTLEICEDCAIIQGKIALNTLIDVIRLCNEEGFTHVTELVSGDESVRFIRE